MKKCKHCQQTKQNEEFYKRNSAKGWLTTNCKTCFELIRKKNEDGINQTIKRMKKKQQAYELELSLSSLCESLNPYQTLTLKEIALYCGCSYQLIHQIERTALLKLRANKELLSFV